MSTQNQVKITIRQFAGTDIFAECQCTIRVDGCSLSTVIPFKQLGTRIEYELSHSLVCFASRFNLIPQLHEVCQIACDQFGQEYGINLYRKFNLSMEVRDAS